MTEKYEGNYKYSHDVVSRWNSDAIGIYYCGYPNQAGLLIPYYIGKGTGEGGIRSRLLDHLREDSWPGVTHFGYTQCGTASEADALEAREIVRCQPKYNQQGK